MGKAQWITNERLKEMKDSQSLIPPVLKGSGRDFRPPPTIESDFKRLLEHDVPHANYTFELIHDWYAAQAEDYEKIFIRAQQTPIDWKSKIGNSDMSENFKTSYDQKIRKGDYVVREDGIIYLLTWNVVEHPNNQASQTTECNDYLTFTREYHAAVDDYGYEIVDDPMRDHLDERGRLIVVKDIPASHSEYSGRPEYSIAESQPGIVPNHLVNMYIQYNSTTAQIRIDDQTKIGDYIYAVHNVYDGETDMNKEYGTLYLQLRRLPGGDVHE